DNGTACAANLCGEALRIGANCSVGTCSDKGFARLNRQCNLVGRTFAHEIGHVMGACHETDDGGGGCDKALPHAYGKRWTCDFGALCEYPQVFVDTMAYTRNSCYSPVIIPYFSHRDLSYNPSSDDCEFCGPCPSQSIGDADTHFSAGTIYFWGRG